MRLMVRVTQAVASSLEASGGSDTHTLQIVEENGLKVNCVKVDYRLGIGMTHFFTSRHFHKYSFLKLIPFRHNRHSNLFLLVLYLWTIRVRLQPHMLLIH